MTVVLLTVDCLRADHVGCYGYSRPTTPNIDEFAENATRYVHSYSNCPGTRWAFQSLHSGVSTIRFDGLGIPRDYESLAGRFQPKGYATGGFAVNGYVSRDYNYDAGFDSYYSVQEASQRDSRITKLGKRVDDLVGSKSLREKVLAPAYRRLRERSAGRDKRFVPNHTDADTVDQALTFIQKQQEAGKDYFCWIHFMDAHTPYGYWPEHLQVLRGDAEIEHTIHPGDEGKVVPGEGPEPEVIDTYDACIRRVDEQMERVLDTLDDDVTIAITGDHGEEFGRLHDLEFHEASVYATYTRVPLLVQTQGIRAGEVGLPVQHLDIPPTLIAAENITIPNHYEGEALQTLDRNLKEPIFFTLAADEVAVRSGEWKYVERHGESALYRVPHMELEETPVKGNREKRKEMSSLLDLFRSKTVLGDQPASLEMSDLSPEVEANLEDLGYR